MAGKKSRIKWNVKGFEQLREDPKVHGDLIRRAHNIANASGGEEMGYLVRDNLAREERSGATVLAIGHAANDNRKNQTLIRNLSSGR